MSKNVDAIINLHSEGQFRTADIATLRRRGSAWLIDGAIVFFFVLTFPFAADWTVDSSRHILQPNRGEEIDKRTRAIANLAAAMNQQDHGSSRHSSRSSIDPEDPPPFWTFLCAIGLGILYRPLFESWTGQTLGKRLLGIRVISDDGRKASVGQCVVRTLAWIIDGIGFVVPIGAFIAVCSHRNRRIGDRAAGTLVVRVTAG